MHTNELKIYIVKLLKNAWKALKYFHVLVSLLDKALLYKKPELKHN